MTLMQRAKPRVTPRGRWGLILGLAGFFAANQAWSQCPHEAAVHCEPLSISSFCIAPASGDTCTTFTFTLGGSQPSIAILGLPTLPKTECGQQHVAAICDLPPELTGALPSVCPACPETTKVQLSTFEFPSPIDVSISLPAELFSKQQDKCAEEVSPLGCLLDAIAGALEVTLLGEAKATELSDSFGPEQIDFNLPSSDTTIPVQPRVTTATAPKPHVVINPYVATPSQIMQNGDSASKSVTFSQVEIDAKQMERLRAEYAKFLTEDRAAEKSSSAKSPNGPRVQKTIDADGMERIGIDFDFAATQAAATPCEGSSPSSASPRVAHADPNCQGVQAQQFFSHPPHISDSGIQQALAARQALVGGMPFPRKLPDTITPEEAALIESIKHSLNMSVFAHAPLLDPNSPPAPLADATPDPWHAPQGIDTDAGISGRIQIASHAVTQCDEDCPGSCPQPTCNESAQPIYTAAHCTSLPAAPVPAATVSPSPAPHVYHAPCAQAFNPYAVYPVFPSPEPIMPQPSYPPQAYGVPVAQPMMSYVPPPQIIARAMPPMQDTTDKQNAVSVLAETCRELDNMAARFEEHELYAAAEQTRQLAQSYRQQSRHFRSMIRAEMKSSQPAEHASPSTTLGFSPQDYFPTQSGYGSSQPYSQPASLSRPAYP